jgi:photosystem II stability/assembly factor-like uncharacterized protein
LQAVCALANGLRAINVNKTTQEFDTMRKPLLFAALLVAGVIGLIAADAVSPGPPLPAAAAPAVGVPQGEDKKKKEEKKKAEDAEEPKKAKGPFKNLKYRLVGPSAGGRVSRACGLPGDPSTYYLAAAAGGVWKTTDGGLNWKPIFDEQSTSSMGAIAVAPSDPNVIYAGSGEANIRGNVEPGNGIYRSTNGGKTWKHVWKQKGQIGRIIVHPTNPDSAYAAVLGSAFGPNPDRGVYRTNDGGRTWSQVLVGRHWFSRPHVHDKKKDEPGLLHTNMRDYENVGAIDVCFDPSNPRILWAALWQTRRTPWSLMSGGDGSGLYRSDNGGDTWKKIGPTTEKERQAADEEDNGLPEGIWGRVGIAIAPGDSRRIYALIEAEKGGLYRSDDAGESWKLMNGGHYLRQRAWYFSQVAVDPGNPDVVWCSNVRLLKSVDGGKTFKNFKGPHHPDHHDLWIDPKNPRRMIDSNDGGVDITTNGGESWFAPPLPICQFYHVNCDNNVPYRVMGCMQDQGTASGPSNSLSSAGISLSDWITVGGGETGFAVPDPSDPNIVYAGEYGGYISRFDLRTRQAANISIYPVNPSGKGAADLRYRFQWTAPIMISPNDARTVYHAANVLFRTRDGGTTWDKISPDLTRDDKSKQQWSGGPITGDNTGAEYYGTIFAIAESPLETGVLWAGSDDGLVHVSRDAGKTWTNVTKNLPGMPEWGTVTCIEASHFEAGGAYVVVDNHRLDDNRPYLWYTSDFGKTWTSQTKGLRPDDFLRVIREDPQEPGLLYAGSAHHVWVRRRGNDWESLQLNMPSVLISDLVVKDNDLVVGTNGRSIWILDDLKPIRFWMDRDKWGLHLFPPQPATRWRFHGENYTGEDRIPGENPPKGALLTYHLEKKPKGPLVLEIFDGSGKLLRKLTNKKQDPEAPEDAPDVPWSIYKPTVLPDEAGLQRVAWDLRSEGPKIIPGAKNDAGTPHEGPMVLPGTYKLKLSVDGEVSESKVQVMLDPRVKLSAKELADRQSLALKIQADISTLSEIVLALRSVREQIQQRIKALPKGAKWVKEAEDLLPKLDALEEQLHNPKAEVTYDILAMKGGARLYSQLTPLYYALMESDAVVTQGIREVYAEHAKELRRLEAEWRALVTGELARLNEQARDRPAIVIPEQK